MLERHPGQGQEVAKPAEEEDKARAAKQRGAKRGRKK